MGYSLKRMAKFYERHGHGASRKFIQTFAKFSESQDEGREKLISRLMDKGWERDELEPASDELLAAIARHNGVDADNFVDEDDRDASRENTINELGEHIRRGMYAEDDDDSDDENQIEPMTEDEFENLSPEETKNKAKEMRDAVKAANYGEDDPDESKDSDSDMLARMSDKDIDRAHDQGPDAFKAMLKGAFAEHKLLLPRRFGDDRLARALGKEEEKKEETPPDMFSESRTSGAFMQFSETLTNQKIPKRDRDKLLSELQTAGKVPHSFKLIR